MCRSILLTNSAYFYRKTATNLLFLLNLILHHGCQLTGLRDVQAFIRLPIKSSGNFNSLLDFLNANYTDPQLTADIARHLYDAGALLNPEEPTGDVDYKGGCHQLRRIAERFQFNVDIDQSGDADRIAWLLHAASEPRSLQDCAICSVRTTLEFDIPYKLERLKDQLPPSLIVAIRKDSCFDSGMPVSP